MMKLTIVVLFGLIGVAIALHGTGAYGNAGGYGNGGYGNNGGHKHDKKSSESSSSESEEFIKPKVCKHECTNMDTFDLKTDGTQDILDCLESSMSCSGCCGAWVFSHGINLLSAMFSYTTSPSDKCTCCIRKCS